MGCVCVCVCVGVCGCGCGCGCVCVCVCLSVCVISTAQTSGSILMKLSTNHLQYICEVLFFSDFEDSNLMTSLRPLLLLSVGALSRSQFCSDFLQILGSVSKSQPTVCYLKSAKSVDNFGSYG